MVKALKITLDIIFILIIIVLVGYFILRLTNVIEIYNVKTGSMEGQIHVGDYILIYKKERYNINDVVTYKVEDGYITHRIIDIEGNMVTTKGDANNTIDEKIDKSSIVGKVILSGGLLNIIIDYKFAIIGLLFSLYLFSCYASENNSEKVKEDSNN